MSQYPLGLPRGSVRAIIALTVIVGCLAYIVLYRDFPQALNALLGVVIGYYFGSRNANGQSG